MALLACLWWRAASLARRLGPAPAAGAPSPTGRPAIPVVGEDLAGRPATEPLDGEAPTVLAFLTSGCATCQPLWAALAAGHRPAGARTVVVTPDPGGEDRRRLGGLAGGAPVVMSTRAWMDYRPGPAPWAVVVVAGRVAAAGHPDSWAALSALVAGATGVTG